MQEHINKLQAALDKITQEELYSTDLLGKPEVMAVALVRVRQSFNQQQNAGPPQDRILQAINSFLRSNQLESTSQARLVSWGLAVSHGHANPLLECKEPFAQFMKVINEFQNANVLLTQAWRGLLSSYLRYPGLYSENNIGSTNWCQLRNFLKETFPIHLQGRQHKPTWMVTLEKNINILDENPCDRYATAMLDDDTAMVEEIKGTLAIPESSWFVAELINAQVTLACSYGDQQFKQYLTRVCNCLRQNVLHVNHSMKIVLERYLNSNDNSEHEELSKLVIEHWGNPKLPSSTKWGLVSPEVKVMVLKWSIGRDLQAFFELFSSDQDADQDQRRLAFWMQYIDQIYDVYFVLGNHAFYSMQEDYLEVKKRNEGRVAKLEKGGTLTNNAFIILVGHYAIVEFGVKYNACFIYDSNNLPFRLGASTLSGDRSELKNNSHRGCKDRLTHQDNCEGFGRWEERFEDKLRDLGMTPDSSSRYSTTTRARKISARTDPRTMLFTMDRLKRFAQANNLKITDNRGKGGSLWVEPDDLLGSLGSSLESWGFKHKVGRGWWIK